MEIHNPTDNTISFRVTTASGGRMRIEVPGKSGVAVSHAIIPNLKSNKYYQLLVNEGRLEERDGA